MKKVDVLGFLFLFMKIVAMKVTWHHFFGVKKNKNLKEDGVRFKTKNECNPEPILSQS